LDSSRFYQIGFKTFSAADGDFDADSFYTVPFGPVTWTITLTDEYGDEWTTSMLTTNYDVIHDDTNNAPLYSLPIIAAGVENPGGTWTEQSDSGPQPAAIPTHWNTFGDGSLHVADQVEKALEALPDGASGKVTVHEIYTSPVVSGGDDYDLLSSSYPTPFTGYDNTYSVAWPVVCGRYDIYTSAADAAADGGVIANLSNSIAGCGVAVVDTELGEAACTDRSGNQDIDDYLWNTGSYTHAESNFGLRSPNDPYLIYGINDGGDETVAMSSDNSPTQVQPSVVNEGTFSIFTVGTEGDAVIYYQYPHFSNGDGADARFPLFEDLVASCAANTGFYASGATYHYDALALNSAIPGLSLFLYFEEATIETQPRVDYTFNNQAADAYAVAPLFNNGDYGAGIGETVEGINGGVSGDLPAHSLVDVQDRGGSRVWDVAYHGRQAYFLDDMSVTSTDVTAHICSKRGLCDYSTGLCDCFSGFTAANCGQQNALAY